MLLFFLAFVLPFVVSSEELSSQESESNNKLELFTPLYLNATSERYRLQGTFCIIGISAVETCTPCSLVHDPVGERILFNFSQSGGGYNTLTSNNSYFYGFQGTPDSLCFATGTTYADQVTWYTKATSIRGSTENDASFLGLVLDNGGCQYPMSVLYNTKKGIITGFSFSQRFPPPGQNICPWQQASIKYDMDTLQKGINVQPYFDTLPSACTTSPVDWCSSVFAVNGPCRADPLCTTR